MTTIEQLAAIVANVLRDCKRAALDVTDVMMLASEQFAKDEDAPATPAPMAAWPTFTIFVAQTNRKGTTYVSAFQCPDIETAKEQALLECACNWGRGDDVDDLFVLGVISGNAEVLEWDDDV